MPVPEEPTDARESDEPVGPVLGPRPSVRRGPGIVNYTQLELVALARWILSDTLLRTHDDLKREMRTELGFSRNGVRIDAALTRAVATVRRSG